MSFFTSISPLIKFCIVRPSRHGLVYYSVGKKIIAEKEDDSFIEDDAEKLAKYVCVNYRLDKEGEGPEIESNSAYPHWLFLIDLKPKKELEDMDPEIDGWNYWIEYKKRQKKELDRYEYLKYRHLFLQNSPSVNKVKKYTRYKYMLKV